MVADREGFTTRYPGRVSLIDLSREASARMEFEPLSDVFCFVSRFGILCCLLPSGAM